MYIKYKSTSSYAYKLNKQNTKQKTNTHLSVITPQKRPQYSIVQPGGYSQLYHRAPEKRSKSDQTEPQTEHQLTTHAVQKFTKTPNWMKNWVKQHWYHTRLSNHPIGALPKSTEALAMQGPSPTVSQMLPIPKPQSLQQFKKLARGLV